MARGITQTQLSSLFGTIGLGLTAIVLAAAIAARIGQNFASQQVHDQLVQEKIQFPPAGSPALNAEEYPGLQRYGGQMVDNGFKAKAYANEFIWVHMMKASGGKTYAEVSSEARANPQDQKLATLRATMFEGSMLRSSLLTVYGFSILGLLAGYTFWAALAAGLALLLATMSLRARADR